MNLNTKTFEKLKYKKPHESENDESAIQSMFLFLFIVHGISIVNWRGETRVLASKWD